MVSYRTVPATSERLPSGIPYIISNEAAERFSYYGMRSILVLFMTRYMVDSSGALDTMSEGDAKGWFHLFGSAVYFTPVLGALLSDTLLGKYRTILWLSLVYCLGHLTLALDETRFGLAVGLGLLAVGAGGIKPCVSAHVGDQFGAGNMHLLPRVFGWFYLAINLGASIAFLTIEPVLLKYGPGVAFGIPGLLMAVATIAFWMGRHQFVHVPPAGRGAVREMFTLDSFRQIGRVLSVFAFVVPFWALFDQQGSSWVIQAGKLDRHFLGVEWGQAQIGALNPIFILVFVPLFNVVIYPLLGRLVTLTALRKIGIGLFLTIPSFVIPAFIEARLADGHVVSIGWQVVAYAVMTAAEVLVSITCLEFAYTEAPRRLKSLVMSCFMLSMSAGNLLTAAINFLIENPEGGARFSGVEYFLFFSALMAVTSVGFVVVARHYPSPKLDVAVP